MPTPEIDLHGHHWVNTIGHCAGVLVFATLFLLIFRDSRRSGHRLRLLPLASTLLALGWDLGLLIGIASRDQSAFWANASAALAFACLSLLPAVLLDLGLATHLRPLRAVGYALGSLCALLHVSEVFVHGPEVHSFALITLSVGFALLAAVSYGISRRLGTSYSPAAAICLFLLSASFLHFRAEADAHTVWSEIILHHAGIPIALFVVLQDYRFLLLDAFLRLTATGALAGLFVAALWQWRNQIQVLSQSNDPFLFGMLLVGAAISLILFAKARERLQGWLTHRIFLRRDPEEIAHALRGLEGDELTMLDRAGHILASYFRAPRFHFSQSLDDVFDASVPIHFLKGDSVVLHLSGRRFLSEDIEMLDRFGEVIAREVDRARNRELERLMMQAELKALQAQIHPHFLFNALNALYGSIPRQAADARRLVLSLSEVFRYFLTTSKSTVLLEEELTIIEAYLEIEKARLGPRLTTSIEIPEPLRSLTIPVLSVEPLVENAIKHGIAAQPGPGAMTLRARLSEGFLILEVHDTGPGPGPHNAKEGNRVGLENVSRRLALHYGERDRLDVSAVPGGTLAQIHIPVDSSNLPVQLAEPSESAKSFTD
jgi:two-component system, LytTR family, sensor kinase